jgi:hypothetical protein
MRQLAMTRDEMIRRLVEFSVKAALGDPRRYWLSELFERGFVGYRKFSDQRLWRELQLRGLVGPEDALVDGDFEDYEPDDAAAILGHPLEAGTRESE